MALGSATCQNGTPSGTETVHPHIGSRLRRKVERHHQDPRLTFMSRPSSWRRGIALAALAALLALPSGLAEARLGGGSGSKGGASMGSRGARTYEAPAPTATSPRAAATIERSRTPDRPQPAPGAEPRFNPAPAAPGGFFSGRGGFFSGLMGGLIGAAIGSLLFGHGLFGG